MPNSDQDQSYHSRGCETEAAAEHTGKPPSWRVEKSMEIPQVYSRYWHSITLTQNASEYVVLRPRVSQGVIGTSYDTIEFG